LSTSEPRREVPKGRYPGLPFLLGKVLDAFLLDHVRTDLEELERVNDLLRDGVAAYGEDFIARTNAVALARGGVERRIVRSLVVRPSEDLGRLAAQVLRRERAAIGRQLGRTLLRIIDVGEGADTADLASYLLFDGAYARELIELGRADARAQHDELSEFLFGA
ncbi:MAG TPA: patatin-like phospholipase family protein, partial [Sandaracinaceae bacterium]